MIARATPCFALILAVLSCASFARAQAWDEPTSAHTGVTAAAPIDTSDAAVAQLEARTSDELAGPLPFARGQLAFELSVVSDQRDAIDVTGVNVMQGFGVGSLVTTGVACLVGAFGALIAALSGGPTPGIVFGVACGAVGGGTLVLGVTLLAVAESDGDLHRRRELDWRARRIRQNLMALSPSGLTITF